LPNYKTTNKINIAGIYSFRYLNYKVDPKPLVFVFGEDDDYILGFNLNYLPLIDYSPYRKHRFRRINDPEIMKYLSDISEKKTLKSRVLWALHDFRSKFYGIHNRSMHLKDFYEFIKTQYTFMLKIIRKYKKIYIRSLVEVELVSM
jgi:hypothetical protein